MKKIFLVALMVVSMVAASSVAFAAAGPGLSNTANRSIVTPYFQVDADSTYSFVAITNTSISGNQSRAVTVKAVDGSGTLINSLTFTIDLGATQKVFVISTNHGSANSSTIPGVQWLTVAAPGTTTVAGTSSGHLVIEGAYVYANDHAYASNKTNAFSDNLSVWGAIYIPSTSSGFAMEFVGDAGDAITGFSQAGTTTLSDEGQSVPIK